MTIPRAAYPVIRAYTARVRRAVREYAHVPDTTRPYGPCVRCWATTVRTLRGVCRGCGAAERKSA